MPTKQTLEQQLEETRADLEALHVRHAAQIKRGDELEGQLRSAYRARESAETMARQHHDRVIYLEADVARLGGMLDGMREVLTGIGVFRDGDHAPPIPPGINRDTLAERIRGRQ